MAEWLVTFLLVAGVGGAIVWWLTHPQPSRPAGRVSPCGAGTPDRSTPTSPRPVRGPLPRTWEERR